MKNINLFYLASISYLAVLLTGCSTIVDKYKDYKPLNTDGVAVLSCQQIDSRILENQASIKELGQEIDGIGATKTGGMDVSLEAQKTLTNFGDSMSNSASNITGALGLLGVLGSTAATFDEARVQELSTQIISETKLLARHRANKGC